MTSNKWLFQRSDASSITCGSGAVNNTSARQVQSAVIHTLNSDSFSDAGKDSDLATNLDTIYVINPIDGRITGQLGSSRACSHPSDA
jgi:hypothetical protein